MDEKIIANCKLMIANCKLELVAPAAEMAECNLQFAICNSSSIGVVDARGVSHRVGAHQP
jgi:hypothetical protein